MRDQHQVMKNNRTQLPQIPNKRYFTIGEVGYLCCVKPHVLRYWEQEFPQLKPAKRRGNRRYYQREDIIMIRNIRGLLYDEGYTISGARIQLDQVLKLQRRAEIETNKDTTQSNEHSNEIKYSFNFTVESDSDTQDNLHEVQKESAPAHNLIQTAKELLSAKTDRQELNPKLESYKAAIKNTVVELRNILSEFHE